MTTNNFFETNEQSEISKSQKFNETSSNLIETKIFERILKKTVKSNIWSFYFVVFVMRLQGSRKKNLSQNHFQICNEEISDKIINSVYSVSIILRKKNINSH